MTQKYRIVNYKEDGKDIDKAIEYLKKFKEKNNYDRY